MKRLIPLDEFLWREADLLDDVADEIVENRMDGEEALEFIRKCAAQLRRASSNATAGRSLVA